MAIFSLVGPMDKAPVYGTGDSGFESPAGLFAVRNCNFNLQIEVLDVSQARGLSFCPTVLGASWSGRGTGML